MGSQSLYIKFLRFGFFLQFLSLGWCGGLACPVVVGSFRCVLRGWLYFNIFSPVFLSLSVFSSWCSGSLHCFLFFCLVFLVLSSSFVVFVSVLAFFVVSFGLVVWCYFGCVFRLCFFPWRPCKNVVLWSQAALVLGGSCLVRAVWSVVGG